MLPLQKYLQISAIALWTGNIQQVQITIAAIGGKPVLPGTALDESLVAAIDNARDPLQQVQVDSYELLQFNLEAKLLIDPRYLAAKVLDQVETTLKTRFAFEQLYYCHPSPKWSKLGIKSPKYGKTVTISLMVISYVPRATNPRWHIEIVPVELENQYPLDRYIRLAQLGIDTNGRIKSIERTVTMFSPGIVRGLNVSVSSSDRSININVSAASGMAVNRQGEVLTLDRDLSASLVDLLDRNSLVQTPADLQNRLAILFLIPGVRPKLAAVLDADIGHL